MKSLIITSGLFIASIFVTNAQIVQKIGHVNSALIMQNMPETKSIRTKLETTKTELEEQLREMMQEYQSKLETLQKQQETMTETVRNSKVSELRNLESRIQEFQQNSQNELLKEENELLQPILNRVRKAIGDVAEDQGYSYVLDETAGSIMFKSDATDITELVKKKLGISIVTVPK